jgi:hypothetical protein
MDTIENFFFYRKYAYAAKVFNMASAANVPFFQFLSRISLKLTNERPSPM